MTGRRGGVPHRGPSQTDVANLAGVSPQTVSRVVAGGDAVRPETRDRVLEVMRELGYRHNRTAAALRSGSTRTIGVLAMDLTSYGQVRTWESLAVAADRAGYSIALVPVEWRTRDAVVSALDRLVEQGVDGVAMLIEERAFAEELEPVANLPAVVIDSGREGRLPYVDVDHAQGARLATGHLLDLGHPTVWHLAGPAGSFPAERRERAWRECLREAGRIVPEPVRGDWTAESGYRAGVELLARAEAGAENPTAVFVANDQMALGLLAALHRADVAVPGRVSVVGFDDTPESSMYWPALTTVRQDFAAIGEAAIRILLDALSGAAPHPKSRIVPTELVVRDSTAAYPA